MTILDSKKCNELCASISKMTAAQLKQWLPTQPSCDLETLYINAKDVYYNKTLFDKRRVLKDAHFDIIEDYITREHETVETTAIGIEPPGDAAAKETLPYFMPSMNKIKTSFADVDKKLEKWLSTNTSPKRYLYSEKLDGVSGMYVYDSSLEEDRRHQLYTRGNGKIGTNISHFISATYMPVLCAFKTFLNQRSDISKLVMRGELILPKVRFNGEQHGSNARNFVAGIINSKTIDAHHSSIIDFVVYELIEPVAHTTSFHAGLRYLETLIDDFVAYSKETQLKCVFNSALKKNDIRPQQLRWLLENRKQVSEYECDGIIITHDCSQKTTNAYKNPDFAFAFKHDDEELFVWTSVEDVLWNVSKHGLLKPTIQVSPITINNVNINYTTGFNAAFIKNNNIGKNTRVCIKRSGDVIPVITEVDHTKVQTPLLPDVSYTWNTTGVDISIDIHDTHSVYYKQYLTKRLHYFTKTIGVKHIGEAIIEKCVHSGIDSVDKLCEFTVEEWQAIDGVKERGAAKFTEQLRKSLTSPGLTLDVIMDASCCFGSSIGPKKLHKITSHLECGEVVVRYLHTACNETAAMEKHLATVARLLPRLEDIGGKNTQEFIEGLREYKLFYNSLCQTAFGPHIELLHNGVHGEENKNNNNNKTGFSVVFTGFRNKELERSLHIAGYSIGSAVSKNTKAVIVKDEVAKTGPSSKLKKAISMSIPLYHQGECLTYLT